MNIYTLMINVASYLFNKGDFEKGNVLLDRANYLYSYEIETGIESVVLS